MRNVKQTSRQAAIKIRLALAQPGGAFPKSDLCKGCGGDPPVRGRRPRRPVPAVKGPIPRAKNGSWGTRADQGVRPTIFAGVRSLGRSACATCVLPDFKRHLLRSDVVRDVFGCNVNAVLPGRKIGR